MTQSELNQAQAVLDMLAMQPGVDLDITLETSGQTIKVVEKRRVAVSIGLRQVADRIKVSVRYIPLAPELEP